MHTTVSAGMWMYQYVLGSLMICIPCICVCMFWNGCIHTAWYCQICTYVEVHICMYLNVYRGYIPADMHLFLRCISVCMWLYFVLVYIQICTFCSVHIWMYLNVFCSHIHAHMHSWSRAYLPVCDCMFLQNTRTYIKVGGWFYCAESAALSRAGPAAVAGTLTGGGQSSSKSFMMRSVNLHEWSCLCSLKIYCAESAARRRMKISRRSTGRPGKHEERAVGCAGPSLSWTRAYGTSSKTGHVWGGSCQQGQQPQLQLHNRLLAKNDSNQTTRSTICEEKNGLKTVPRRKLKAEILIKFIWNPKTIVVHNTPMQSNRYAIWMIQSIAFCKNHYG